LKILILSTAEAYRKILREAARKCGHQIRVQQDSDGLAETRSKVRWADMVVAAGNLRENAVGALYLAFDQKKKVTTVEMQSPGWVTACWGNRSFAEWAGMLPVLDEQRELFT
jgi:hypothetical protein